jgi:MarR family transcriptional regulator, temperature-dependent positive regulator of motility
MDEFSANALLAIRSWLRLEQAFAAYNRDLRNTFGVTGSQLAMLRIIHELEPITLANLRKQLTMHPATLGQLIERLARQGLVKTTKAEIDRRLRQVVVTSQGIDLLTRTPLAGPVRLRKVSADDEQLQALAHAFEDALNLFGLEGWVE